MDKNQDKNFYGLSVRGYQYAINPSRIDHALFMEARQNLYNPEDNPLGSFPLNMAENQLMAPILKAKLSNYVKANEMSERNCYNFLNPKYKSYTWEDVWKKQK